MFKDCYHLDIETSASFQLVHHQEGYTPGLFYWPFNNPDQHYNPNMGVYRQGTIESMVSLEKEWVTILTSLYKEEDISIDAKITAFYGKPTTLDMMFSGKLDLEPIALGLIRGSDMVVSPEADVSTSGLGRMVALQVN